MYTDSFIFHAKSSYEIERYYPQRKAEKGLVNKNVLREKIMKQFLVMRPKTVGYLKDEGFLTRKQRA